MKSFIPVLRLSLLISFLTIITNSSFSQCSITGLDPTYCIDDADATLTGTPLGGTFSGPGMTGTVFSPAGAGVGVHTITYTLPGDEDKYYIKSNIGNPWGSTSNQTAMDVAFGGGGWILGSFEVSDPAVVFSPTTSLVFLEGSDGHANELNTFLIANLALIETWVDEGGCLLLNAAPNEGTDINFGFGGTTLDYPSFAGTVDVVDVAHPAVLGPIVPTATTMTGPYYAHGRILGAGYTNVLTNGANVILAEKAWGLGTVMVGGMTTHNWHAPAPQAGNYRANLLTYLNSLAVTASCTVSQDVEVFDLPTVTASTDAIEICDGETVTLTGGGADTYTWDLGVTDGTAFTPAATGTASYTVIGTNTTTTCQNTASIDVTMHPLPTITASASATEICLGEAVTLNGAGGDSYMWDMGVTDGVAFTPASAGTFTFTVTGTNGPTGCQNTATIDITVYDNPTVTATASPDEICIGETITFTGGGADTYTWDGGITDGVAFTPATAGTFTYNVTGTLGASGCENSNAVSITVHDLPVVTAAVDEDEVCEGEAVTFTGGGADSYAWDMGVTDGVPFTPGVGTATYTVTGTNVATTCENTAAIDVIVNPLPIVTANADFTEVCTGDLVTLTGGGSDTYTWDLGVADGVAFAPPTGTTTYTVTGTNGPTGCQNTATIDITVYDNPTVTATASPDEICIGETITFTGGGADTYTWDGGITDGVAFTPATAGTFTYNVTGTLGASGCENSNAVSITVHDLPVVTAAVDEDEVCEGEAVTFTGGGADSYAWDMGVTDGVPFTPGVGTATYTVTGTNVATTCENTAAIDVTVNPLPIVTANADFTEVCTGDLVTLTGGGSDTYTWDLGVTNGVAFAPPTGTTTYTVTGTNGPTGCQNTATIDITVYDNPTVTATASPDEICIGETITFTGGGADTYTWDGGITDGVAFTPATAGTFTYNVTGTLGASGCENSNAVSITVHDLPVVTAAVDEDEVCEGEAVTFTGGGADSYAWDMGVTDGVPFTPGVGTATYTVTGTNVATTCENTAAIDVTVNPLPIVTANADFTEVCTGDLVTLTGGGSDTYTWDLGVTDGVAFAPPTGTTTYTVTGTNGPTGCQNTATIDITVYDNPTVTATASPDEICIGESITFTGGGADTYTWDGGVTDGDPFTPLAIGSYTFNVIGSLGASGCENSASVTIVVNDLPVVGATADLSEVCDGENIILNGTGADTYTWDLGVTDGIAFAPPVGATTYNVIGTNTVTGCQNTASITITVNPLPAVIASADVIEICLGDDLVFTGSGADTYTWDLAVTDGVAFTPASAGTFTHTVIGTDGATSCENSASIAITVYDNPIVTATASPSELCIGESTVLTGAGADTYTWDGGVTDGVAFVPPAAGTFTFNVTGSLGALGCENSTSIDITVYELPTVAATATPSEICDGETTILAGSGAATYTWDLGVTDGVPFTPAALGSTTYNVTGTSSEGCENTSSISVLVNPLPTVTASASETEICLGSSVSLFGAGAATYTWDGGVTDAVAFTPASEGTFTYNVVGTSAAGCEATASIEITVIECEEVLADFEFDNNICVGECITFNDLSLGTIVSWEWDFGGGAAPSTSSEQNPTVCFNTVGSYDISLTITNLTGTTSSITNSIMVNALPVVNAEMDTIITIGGTANLIANTESTGTFSWSPDEEIECVDCQFTTASPQDSIRYTVLLIDENGCQAQDNVLVLVNFVKALGVPSAFSPNGDGQNDVLFVKGFGILSLEFTIYNRFGEVVFQSNDQTIGWDGTFMNQDENPGVFTWVVQYNMEDGSAGTLKGNTTLMR